MSFLKLAMPLLKWGIPVFPLRPKHKVPAEGMADWPGRATDDMDQVASWDTKYPEANIGIALRFNEFCALEFDRGGIAAIAAICGQSIPETWCQLSGGHQTEHHLFEHIELSNSTGGFNHLSDAYCQDMTCPKMHVQGKIKAHRHEEWSFRANRQYIVGPGSEHPDTHQLYRFVRDIKPTPLPSWLYNFLLAKRTVGGRSEGKPEDAIEVLDEFDPEDAFFAHYGIEIIQRRGYWLNPRDCPIAGRQHTNLTDTAFYWNADTHAFGFKCHAAGCEGSNMGIGDVIRYLNEEFEPFHGTIWPKTEADEEFDAQIAAMMEDDASVLEPVGAEEASIAISAVPWVEEAPLLPAPEVPLLPAPAPETPLEATEEWLFTLLAIIFKNPTGVHPDFAIWRTRLTWIVERKAYDKTKLKLLTALIRYEGQRIKLPTRDEFLAELVAHGDTESVALAQEIGLLAENFSIDYAADKLLTFAELLDEKRTATAYLNKVIDGKSREEARKFVREQWQEGSLGGTRNISVDGSVQDKAEEIYADFERSILGTKAEDPLAFTTPFPSIDRKLNSAAERCFGVVGPFSNFKTTVALSIAFHFARTGKPVLFVTGEHDSEKLEKDFYLKLGFFKRELGFAPSYKEITSGEAKVSDLPILAALRDDLRLLVTVKAPIVVKSASLDFNNDLSQILSYMEKTHKKYGWQALFIDPFDVLLKNVEPEKKYFESANIAGQLLDLKTSYRNGTGLIVFSTFQTKKAVAGKVSELRQDPDSNLLDYEAVLDVSEIDTYSPAAQKFDFLMCCCSTTMQMTEGVLTHGRTRSSEHFEPVPFRVDAKSHYCLERQGSQYAPSRISPADLRIPAKRPKEKILSSEEEIDI